MSAGVEWVRALDLNRTVGNKMYSNLSPQDPQQGAIGDCWLVSCLSSAAAHSHLITDVLESHDIDNLGKYAVHLFDVSAGDAGDWVRIVVDDRIPCRPRDNPSRPAQPLFTHNHHNGELWPMIVEKAFAKHVGAYGHLVGGKTIWGWQALGACSAMYVYAPVQQQQGGGKMGKMGKGMGTTGGGLGAQWRVMTNNIDEQRRLMEENRQAGQANWKRTVAIQDTGCKVSSDNLFDHFESMSTKGMLAEVSCCQQGSRIPRDEHQAIREYGIVNGHAYAALNVGRFQMSDGQELRLIRIRNPWANRIVWKGAWGPNCPNWDEHPEVVTQVEALIQDSRHHGDDGIFWMALEDFITIFREVEECVLHSDADQTWEMEDGQCSFE